MTVHRGSTYTRVTKRPRASSVPAAERVYYDTLSSRRAKMFSNDVLSDIGDVSAHSKRQDQRLLDNMNQTLTNPVTLSTSYPSTMRQSRTRHSVAVSPSLPLNASRIHYFEKSPAHHDYATHVYGYPKTIEDNVKHGKEKYQYELHPIVLASSNTLIDLASPLMRVVHSTEKKKPEIKRRRSSSVPRVMYEPRKHATVYDRIRDLPHFVKRSAAPLNEYQPIGMSIQKAHHSINKLKQDFNYDNLPITWFRPYHGLVVGYPQALGRNGPYHYYSDDLLLAPHSVQYYNHYYPDKHHISSHNAYNNYPYYYSYYPSELLLPHHTSYYNNHPSYHTYYHSEPAPPPHSSHYDHQSKLKYYRPPEVYRSSYPVTHRKYTPSGPPKRRASISVIDTSLYEPTSGKVPTSYKDLRNKTKLAQSKLGQHRQILDRYLPLTFETANVQDEVDKKFDELTYRIPQLYEYRAVRNPSDTRSIASAPATLNNPRNLYPTPVEGTSKLSETRRKIHNLLTRPRY